MPRPVCPSPPPLQRLPGHPEFFPSIQQTSVSSSRPLQPSAPSGTPPLPHRVNQRSSNPTIRAAVYISLYVDVNTFIGGRQPQNKLMRLRTFKIRAGGRSASFRPSAFPGQATKRVSLASFCPWGAWPPIPLRFVLARLHWARSVRRPGALARAPLFSAVPVGAGSWGGGGGLRSGSSLGRGGGWHPPCLGGWGPWPPRLAGRWGGTGGGRAAASLLPLWVAARGTPSWPPLCRRRTPLRRARAVGVTEPPRGGEG